MVTKKLSDAYKKAKAFSEIENQPQIVVDKTELDNLINEFPSAKKEIENELKSICEYYNKNPAKFGNEETKKFYIKKIKENILLRNFNFVPTKKKKEEPQKENKNINLIGEPDETSLSILKDPNLFNSITEKEFDKKIVGEIEARKTILNNTNMRLVENKTKGTDNLNVNAKTGTGKDAVSEAVYEIIPPEEKEELIRISPKVLAYTRNRTFEPNATWKKVTLRLEDVTNITLNDDGFKVMLSASPNKINKAKIVWKGKVIPYEIEGKPSITMTMANPNPKEENLRRVPTCFLDEGINQTKEILKRQAEYAKKGKSLDYDEKIINALRFLKVVSVKIPYAEKLVEIFNPHDVIVRTHFPRFLDYIKASCAFHQYQRKQDEEGYFLAEQQDYEIARICLIKTTTNILMIPLTKLQDNILNCFEKNNIQNKSIDEISEFKEIETLNITEQWLRIQLDWLVSKTFLNKGKEKRIDEAGRTIPKPVFIYSYNKMQKLIVPTWEELSQSSLNALNSKIAKNTLFTLNTNQEKTLITPEPKSSDSLIKEGVIKVIKVKKPKVHINDFDIDFSNSGIKKLAEDKANG